MNPMNKFYAATGGAMALALMSVDVFAAADLDVTVGAGAEYHDNALQTKTDKRSDYARVVNAGVVYRNPQTSLPIIVDYRIERRDFEHDLQEDETSLTGNSSLVWAALPRTLDFRLGHQASSQVVDRRGPNITNNREQRSIASAGANLYGRLGAVDTLVLSPSFTDVQVTGDVADDSERTSLGAGWEHRLSEVSALTFNVSRSKIDSENSINDYDLDVATLGLKTRLSRLSYSLEAGGNRIERDGLDDVSGAMVQLGADYNGGDISWGVSYVNRLTDSSVGLEGFAAGGDASNSSPGGDGNVGEFDIVHSNEADIHATYRFNAASSLTGRIGYLDYDYEDTPRDERDYTAELRYNYIVNTHWQLDFGVTRTDADFTDDPNDLKQKETVVDVSATYHFTRQLDLRATLGREERDVNAELGDYDDNYAMLSLNYIVY